MRRSRAGDLLGIRCDQAFSEAWVREENERVFALLLYEVFFSELGPRSHDAAPLVSVAGSRVCRHSSLRARRPRVKPRPLRTSGHPTAYTVGPTCTLVAAPASARKRRWPCVAGCGMVSARRDMPWHRTPHTPRERMRMTTCHGVVSGSCLKND